MELSVDKNMRRKLAVILGPTATGKSYCAVELAKCFDGEIISGDSMLVYRGMDVGTAKPSLAERCGIPHHLIDIREPHESFNAVEFKNQAAALIEEINQRGRLPIIAGGTVLYIKALLEDYSFCDMGEDKELRRSLEEEAAASGPEALYDRLQQLDAKAAATIHPNNVRRTIRALEKALRGYGVSSRNAGSANYDAAVFGLAMERKLLYERINRRVDVMLDNGLKEEVRSLLEGGADPCWQSMQGIGYRQMVRHLQGELPFDEAVEKIKQATRNFAKRQQTWYKRLDYVKWFELREPVEYKAVLEAMSRILVEKFK